MTLRQFGGLLRPVTSPNPRCCWSPAATLRPIL